MNYSSLNEMKESMDNLLEVSRGRKILFKAHFKMEKVRLNNPADLIMKAEIWIKGVWICKIIIIIIITLANRFADLDVAKQVSSSHNSEVVILLQVFNRFCHPQHILFE